MKRRSATGMSVLIHVIEPAAIGKAPQKRDVQTRPWMGTEAFQAADYFDRMTGRRVWISMRVFVSNGMDLMGVLYEVYGRYSKWQRSRCSRESRNSGSCGGNHSGYLIP